MIHVQAAAAAAIQARSTLDSIRCRLERLQQATIRADVVACMQISSTSAEINAYSSKCKQ